MTVRIAAQNFDYTAYPSAYCLFETFCPSDKTDEELENALTWKEYADTLPCAFAEQVRRIWRLLTDNRTALEMVSQAAAVHQGRKAEGSGKRSQCDKGIP